MNPDATLPLSPLDPVASRRRSVWVTVLSLAASVAVVFLEETWLVRARVRLDRSESMGKALGGALDFPAAVAAAVVLFAFVEILRVALALARAGGAEGLRALPPAGRLVGVLILVAGCAALAPPPGPGSRVLSIVVGVATAVWLSAMGVGRGVVLLTAPAVAPTTFFLAEVPVLSGLLGVGITGLWAVTLAESARRFPRLACAVAAAVVAGHLYLAGRIRLTRITWGRADAVFAALAAVVFVGVAYGVRVWSRRSRR